MSMSIVMQGRIDEFTEAEAPRSIDKRAAPGTAGLQWELPLGYVCA